MPLSTTALRLRQLRAARNMSQQEVADALGITRTAYNKYENGVIQPTRTAKKLARLFGVSIDFILCVDERLPSNVSIEMPLEEMIRKYLQLGRRDRGIVNAVVDELFWKRR